MNKISITESRNLTSTNIDIMDSIEIAKTINLEDQKIANAVANSIPQIALAIDIIAESIKNGGKVAYFGAGTSGRLGVLDAAECPPTFGTHPSLIQGFIAGGDRSLRKAVEYAEDSAEMAIGDLQKFSPSPNDVVIAISSSGNPLYCITALQKAKEYRCKTVAITCNPEAKMSQFADINICIIVGPEVITGSSRMKAGTAQKMVLNMLSTGAMIRCGKTYENYMIDLQLTNQKLIKRGIRFISEIGGVSDKQAMEYLEKSGRNVKTACVMASKHCTKEEAEQMLEQYHGLLRKVVEDGKI